MLIISMFGQPLLCKDNEHAANGVPWEAGKQARAVQRKTRCQSLEMPDEVPGTDQSEVLGAVVEGTSAIRLKTPWVGW